MKNYLSQKDSVHNKFRIARKGLMLLFVALLTFGSSAPAISSPTYAVPAGGLSFDANGAVQANPCTAGFGNSLSYATGETDEVNGLIAGEFLTYRNVATIDGQVIDAKVTLTSISGMRAERSASVLDRLDKCDIDNDTGLVEINFRSETASPGDANFVLTIDFLANGTPVTLTNLKMNVEDVDNDQYLEVDNFTSTQIAAVRDADNLQEYRNGDIITVSSGQTSALSTTASARRFHASGNEDSSPNQADKDKHVVEVTYASVSSLVLRLGAYKASGGSFDLNFKGFTFTAPTQTVTSTPPVVPSSGPTAAPAAAAPAVRKLATTGVSEQLTLGIIGSAAVIMVVLGAFLTRMRRKVS